MLETTKLSIELCKFFEQNKHLVSFREKFKEELISSYENLSLSVYEFFDKVNTLNIPFLFALPNKGFKDFLLVNSSSFKYRVGSVDGSQIEDFDYIVSGAYEFLINIGSIVIDYENCSVPYRISKPEIFGLNEISEFIGSEIGEYRSYSKAELISSIRTYCEYSEAMNLLDMLKDGDLLLMDGGLVQWHLQDKPLRLKNIVVDKICKVLSEADYRNVYVVGYISGSKASDVVNCLKIHNCKNNSFDCKKCSDEFCNFLDYIDDSFLFNTFFKATSNELVATPIFQSRAKITTLYRTPVYFFYLYNDSEFARIEISKGSIENVFDVTKKLNDQMDKGFGYPVSLAEAHEMAVVSDNDKANFERIMKTMSPEFEFNLTRRNKVISKRIKFI